MSEDGVEPGKEALAKWGRFVFLVGMEESRSIYGRVEGSYENEDDEYGGCHAERSEYSYKDTIGLDLGYVSKGLYRFKVPTYA